MSIKLLEGEKVLRVYHHHPTPFIFNVLKVILAFSPFYFLLWGVDSILSLFWAIIGHLVLIFFFILVIIYISLIYWLDRLVITNMRIIYIDYKYLTVRDDSVAFLEDIQDVKTDEKGLLAYFKFFDYGTMTVDTPSSYITLIFEDAPNPEGIRQFVYHVKSQ